VEGVPQSARVGVGRYLLKLIYAELKLPSLENSAETKLLQKIIVEDFPPWFEYLFRLGVKLLLERGISKKPRGK
jgi:hypothetical protein